MDTGVKSAFRKIREARGAGFQGDIDHLEVFFVDSDSGWAVVKRDERGNQLGDAEYRYRKNMAIDTAEKMADRLDVEEIKVYKKDRSLDRTIYPE